MKFMLATMFILLFCKTFINSMNVYVGYYVHTIALWHERLGHMIKKGLYYLDKLNVFSKDITSKLDFCEIYVLGKQHRLSFNSSLNETKFLLDYVHVNMRGPSKVQIKLEKDKEKKNSIVDDCSRKV